MLDVRMIAATEVFGELYDILPTGGGWEYFSSAETLSEFAGRGCYQSWSRPNLETARTSDYIIKNILAKGHESVLEHASATFYVQGVSRALGYELLRHRHLSRSELSQRYVDMEGAEYVQPPALYGAEKSYAASEGMSWPPDKGHEMFQRSELFSDVREAYGQMGELLEEQSDPVLTRKEIRESQRAFLPNCTETKFTVTGNYRAWRHVIKMRGALDADAEIREFAVEVFKQLSEHSPAIFADMELRTDAKDREYVAVK